MRVDYGGKAITVTASFGLATLSPAEPTSTDAHALVKKHAHWVTPSEGGRGAARDLCEMIMLAQGTHSAEMQRYL
mgnify:CR=1 FL=1